MKLPRRRHKYGAKARIIDGIRFASLKEANRYCELLLLQREGKIRNLEVQPSFPLVVNGSNCGSYIADFRYLEVGQEIRVVEDVKGVKTAVYRLKKKLVLALYGIHVVEV